MNETNVLLIEDNPDHQIITEKILKRVEENCKIEVINHGEKALDYIKSDRTSFPDFILLDCDMPSVSSLDILKTARKNKLWQNIPIWMIATWCEGDQIEQAYKLGIEGHFEKPLDKKGMESVKQLFINQ